MKKQFKRVMGSALAALVLVSGTPALSAFAAEEEVPFEFMHIEYSDPGEYGYVDYDYVLSNGEEVDLSKDTEQLLFTSAAPTLPSSYDAREDNVVTAAKSQGVSGNCWVFSAVSALETDSIMKGLTEAESTDFSEAHLSWFASRTLTDNENDLAYGDGINHDSPYLKGGNSMIASAALARRSGLANESDFPFYGTNFTKMGNYAESDRYNTDSGVILESAQELQSTDSVKEWILEHGSAVVSMYYDEEYYTQNTVSYCYNNGPATNHQVTIVGWDDDYSAENFKEGNQPEQNGAWLCKNSWGPYWGSRGFFWISYYDTSLSCYTGFSARSTENMSTNYSYNGANWRTALMLSGSMEAANVFRAAGREKLTSVSIYTAAVYTTVEVTIYNNLPENYTAPNQGTKVATIKTTLENMGYHTLYLDSAIDLYSGDIFAIAVRYTGCSGVARVPVEKNGSNENAYFSRSRESYINTNMSRPNWKESSSYNVQNAYIQAMTEKVDCSHEVFVTTILTHSTCTTQGTVADICTTCGFTCNEICIPVIAHEYGEWSEYVHDHESGNEVSTRECEDCGQISTRSYKAGNSVPANDFFESFVRRFIEMFMQMFMSSFMMN